MMNLKKSLMCGVALLALAGCAPSEVTIGDPRPGEFAFGRADVQIDVYSSTGVYNIDESSGNLIGQKARGTQAHGIAKQICTDFQEEWVDAKSVGLATPGPCHQSVRNPWINEYVCVLTTFTQKYQCVKEIQ